MFLEGAVNILLDEVLHLFLDKAPIVHLLDWSWRKWIEPDRDLCGERFDGQTMLQLGVLLPVRLSLFDPLLFDLLICAIVRLAR